jgi:hypothetical protein
VILGQSEILSIVVPHFMHNSPGFIEEDNEEEIDDLE